MRGIKGDFSLNAEILTHSEDPRFYREGDMQRRRDLGSWEFFPNECCFVIPFFLVLALYIVIRLMLYSHIEGHTSGERRFGVEMLLSYGLSCAGGLITFLVSLIVWEVGCCAERVYRHHANFYSERGTVAEQVYQTLERSKAHLTLGIQSQNPKIRNNMVHHRSSCLCVSVCDMVRYVTDAMFVW